MNFYCSVQTGNSLYTVTYSLSRDVESLLSTQTRNRRESVVCMLAIDAFRDKKGGGSHHGSEIRGKSLI